MLLSVSSSITLGERAGVVVTSEAGYRRCPRGLKPRALDARDPLASFFDRFVVDDPSVVYLDGNSLGRLPLATVARLRAVVEVEWGRGLVGSWEHWVDDATRVGDLLGTTLLGAIPGETLLADSTTVNLYKLLSAACAARSGPIVCDTHEFPTDRYVAGAVGDVVPTIAPGVSVVLRSVVDYRTGALADMAAVTAEAHAAGALMLWDCSHAIGAVPLALRDVGADLAVGSTYKHLCAGPGAPAFLWVHGELHDELRQPIAGWWGQTDRFAMERQWDPLPGIRCVGVGHAARARAPPRWRRASRSWPKPASRRSAPSRSS